MDKPWSLYIIRCGTGALYTGISTDVSRRFNEHQASGKLASRFLRGKGPLELMFACPVGDRSQATRLERRVKVLSRDVKEALISGKVTLDTLFTP